MTNPEIGRSVDTGPFTTNYHDVGEGRPLLLHGSGPGVSAMANWRLPIQHLAPHARILAPDLAGFGYTRVPAGTTYTREVWLRQIVDFLDAMGVERTSVVGNSFGGPMALALAIAHPERSSGWCSWAASACPSRSLPAWTPYGATSRRSRPCARSCARPSRMTRRSSPTIWCGPATRRAPGPGRRRPSRACSPRRGSAGSMPWRTRSRTCAAYRLRR